VDYEETYAAVAKAATLRTMLAIAAKRGLAKKQLDVVTAFLNSEIGPDSQIYVEQPTGYHRGPRGLVCKLQKALYGLKQAPMLWFERFSRYVENVLGFRSLDSDPCLFIGGEVVLLLYVDDLLLFAEDASKLEEVTQCLAAEFNMQDLEEVEYYLGIRVMTHKNGGVSLLQDGYIQGVLEQWGIANCKAIQAPMVLGGTKASGKVLDDPVEYQRLVGSLLWVAILTRPDIVFAVGWLGRYASAPTEGHMIAAKRVLRYLAGTRRYGIGYSAEGDLWGSCDASFAEDTENRRSTTGYAFWLGGGPVVWRSSRQKIVTLSSTEAEYVGYCEAAKEAAWLRQLLEELGEAPKDRGLTVPVEVDNQGALAIAANKGLGHRTKHIDVRYHYVREQLQGGGLTLGYRPTEDLVADGLTKPLTGTQFMRFRDKVGVKAVADSEKA
jgi:hypothetical protein